MSAYRDYMKKKRDERESSNTLSSSYSSSSNDYRSYMASKKNNFDSLADDETNLRSRLNSAYSNWTSQDDLASLRTDVENMSNRLKAYKMYGGATDTRGIDSLVSSYDKAVKDFDNLSSVYGYYQNADAYNSARDEYNWVSKNSGLTYDQVKERLNNSTDDKEKDYLSRYGVIAGYNSLEDYDKELEEKKDTKANAIVKVKRAINDFSNLVDPTKGYTDEEKYYADLEEKRNLYKIDNYLDPYQSLEENEDFLEKSHLDYESNKKNVKRVGKGRSVVSDENAYEDELSKMTPKEKLYANYIGNTQGEEAYRAYMEDIRIAVDKRKFESNQEKINEFADEHPIVTTGLSFATNLASEPLTLLEEAGGLITGNYNPYANAAALNNYTSGARERIGENIANVTPNAEVLGVNAPQFAYQIATSIGDTWLGSKALGMLGKFVTGTTEGGKGFAEALSVLMGGGAFNGAYKDGIERGLSEDQALAIGLANGINEYLFEKISLDRLLSDKSLTSKFGAFLNTLAQAGVEGSEEVFTDMANMVAEQTILGSQSELAKRVDEYRKQGYSDDEVLSFIKNEVGSQLAQSFIGGAASGGLMGGIDSFSGRNSYKSNVSLGEQIRSNQRVEDFADVAESIASNNNTEEFSANGDSITGRYNELKNKFKNKEGSTTKDYLEFLKKKYSGDITKATDGELGVLYKRAAYEASKSLKEENFNDLKDFTYGMILGLGEEDANAKVIAESVTKSLLGERLDRDDRNIIKMDVAKEAIKEITNPGYDYLVGDESDAFAKALKDYTNLQKVSVRKEGSIKGVKYDKNKPNVVEITDEKGETEKVKLKDLDKKSLQLIDTSLDYNEEDRKVFLEHYNGQNISSYDASFDYISSMAKADLSLSDAMVDKMSATIPGKEIIDIYKEITKSESVITEDKAEKAKEIVKRVEGKFKAGEFKSEVDRESLTNKEKKLYDLAEAFSSIGFNINLINDATKSFNGNYDQASNTVTINLKARYAKGQMFNSAYVVSSLAHEFTHWLEYNDHNDVYKFLERAVRESLGDDKFDKYVADEQKKNKLSKKDATSEVIARACEDMLNKPEDFSNLFVGADDTTLAKVRKAVMDFFDSIKDIIKELLGNYESENDIAKELREIDGAVDKLRNIWRKALTSAIEFNQMVEKAEESVGLMDDGNYIYPATPEDGILNSQQTLSESDYAKNPSIATKEIAKKTGLSEKKVSEYIKAVNGIGAFIREHSTLLDYKSLEGKSAWVSNPEYGGSLDYSFLCPKRLTYTGTMNAIRRAMIDKKMDVPFSVTDFLFLRNSLVANGFEAPCSFCFVESARMRFDKYNKKFIKLAIKQGLYVPSFNELNNPDLLEEMKKTHPETFDAYIAYTNSLSQRKPKMLEERRAYDGDILKAFGKKTSDKDIKYKNLHGGIRFNSFSDFEVVHMIDSMQAILDMSRIGLAGFGYTKQAGFAKVFGTTGLKVNLSCVAKSVSADGRHIVFDDVEGMNSKEAIEIRNNPRYADNVGICCVVFNDEQLIAALCDERIDYVLPFHRSQWSSADYAKLNLPMNTKDFTKAQTEKGADGKRLKEGNTPFLSYWNFDESGEWNVQNYLDSVINNKEKDAETPLFPSVLQKNADGTWGMYVAKDNSQEELNKELASKNYWKLLTEFKMYNNGKPCRQNPVQPTFAMDEANNLLNDVVEKNDADWNAFPVANDVVDEFLDYKINGVIPEGEKYDAFRDVKNISFSVKYVKDGETQIDNKTGKLKLSSKSFKAEDLDKAVMMALDKGLDVDVDATMEYYEDNTSLNSSQVDSESFDWLDSLSIDELIVELKINVNSSKNQKQRAEKRVDEVNKRLKKIGLTFNGTSVAGWTDDNIERNLNRYAASNKNYAQAYIAYMSPMDFLNLTMGGNTVTVDRIESESAEYGELDTKQLGSENIPIFLDIEEGRSTVTIGHEGRHRMMLLGKAGFEKVPVLLFNYDNKYSKETKTNVKLKPQTFGNGYVSPTRSVVIDEMIPFSTGNKDLITEKFGKGNADANVLYSSQVGNGIKKLYDSTGYTIEMDKPFAELNQYSQKRINFLTTNSKKIIPCQRASQLLEFVEKSKTISTYNKNFFYGMVPQRFVNEMKNKFNENVADYNIVLFSSDVRKAYSHHGDNNEVLRGQRPINEFDFFNVPRVFADFDSIEYGGLYKGKRSYNIKKNGFTIFSYVVDSNMTIPIRSLYANIKNEAFAELPSANNALGSTAKPGIRTASMVSLPLNNNKVNTKEDEEYFNALIDGDFKKAKDMVRIAAQKAGYIKKGFHGTNIEFNVFDINKAYKNTTRYVNGSFFSINKDVANIFATINTNLHGGKERVVEAYLKMDNPFFMTGDQFIKMGFDKEEHDNILSEIHNGGYDSIIVSPRAYQDNKLSRVGVRAASNKAIDVMSEHTYADVKEWVRKSKYEDKDASMIHSGVSNPEFSFVQFAVFSPEQIKSADTIVYDDDGNIIPLSERFNEKSSDIRYSNQVDSDGNKLTENQTSFFADSKARDEKGNLLKMYHGTESDFTTFKSNEFIKEKNGLSLIKGWFSEDREYSERYGDKVKEYYLNITNPLILDEQAKTLDGWKKFFRSNGIKGVVFDSSVTGENGYRDTLKGATYEDGTYYSYFEILDSANYWYGDGNVTEMIAKAGYDGIQTNDEFEKAWMPFHENQIKSVNNLNPTDHPDTLMSRQEETYTAKKVREDREIREEMALRKSTIEKITNNAKELSRWIEKPDKNHRVPKDLQKPIAEVITAIDFSSKQMLGLNKWSKNSGQPTKNDISLSAAFEHLSRLLTRVDDVQQNGKDDDGLALTTYLDLPANYASELGEISSRMNDIARDIKEDNVYILNEMTSEELKDLLQKIKILRKSVTQFNNLLANANAHSVDNVAQKTIQFVNKLGQRKINNTLSNFLAYDELLPYYAFKRFGDGAEEMFGELMDGWDKFAFNVKQITDFTEKTFSGKDASAWSKELHEFTIKEPNPSGTGSRDRQLTLSTAQIMSLYCLSKREHAMGHLLGGGIVPTDIEIRDDYVGIKGKTISQPNAVRLTKKELGKILEALDEKQIKVADELQKFMNTVCSEWGNEITMKRFGVMGFTEENYFPIKADSNIVGGGLRGDDANKSIYALLNMSFTKPLTPGANNQIMVDDIFNVFAVHTSDMAKYNSIALPVLDMVKWWNYKESNKGRVDNATKIALETAFGKRANNYILNFLSDLNGNRESHRGENLQRSMLSKYKRAAVGANLQVALLQPLSYVRAYNVLDKKYLNRALKSNWKRGIEESKEHSGLTIWKDFGFFSTDISRGLDAIIRQQNTMLGKGVEMSMELAGKMDSLTWGIIWNACKMKVDEETNLAKGSDEYYKAINDEMRNVIYATQVIDSTMSRSEFMRGTSMVAQLDSAFLSEPTISVNVVMHGVSEYIKDTKLYGKGEAFKRNKKYILKSITLHCISALLESALRGAIKKVRKPEDDEGYLESVFEQFKEELNPFGKLPWFKDLVSAFQGYNAERLDEQWMIQLYNTYKSINKAMDEGIEYKTVFNMLKLVSQLSGLPLASATTEIVTFWNLVFGNMFPSLRLTK